MDAFRDHGTVAPPSRATSRRPQAVMARLAEAGIDIDAVGEALVEEGVQLFIDAADKLLGAVAAKRADFLGPKLERARPWCSATRSAPAAKKAVEAWRASGTIRRLWAHDKTVWSGADEDRWLGWLRIVEDELDACRRLRGLRRGGARGRLHRRRRARHGRVEPRPGGARRDLRHPRGLPAACASSIPPTRIRSARRRPRSTCRPRCSSWRASPARPSSPTCSATTSSAG